MTRLKPMPSLIEEAPDIKERLMLLHIRLTSGFNFTLRPEINWFKVMDRVTYMIAGMVVLYIIVVGFWKG